MPTKRLPESPSLQHLKLQAKDLRAGHRARALDAYQRIREFHPRFRGLNDAAIGDAAFTLNDAQLTIAREYGFSSWPRLKAHTNNSDGSILFAPQHERIADEDFRLAVDLIDSGKTDDLREHVKAHPDLVHRRLEFEGANYFTNPTLLEFIAENPTRRGSMPSNIVDLAKIIIGAGVDRASLDDTLDLVSSSSVARECGFQRALIDLFCDCGANPNAGIHSALLYGEFDAVTALLERGAAMDIVVAAGIGRTDGVRALLSESDADSLQRALAMAAQHGRIDAVRLLLDAGADPNAYNPVGGHSHATPLHQAVAAAQFEVVRLLVDRGARLDIRDIHNGGTAADWAEHFGHVDLAQDLRSREAKTAM